MVDKKHMVLLCLIIIIMVAPLIIFKGFGENQGYFTGSDDAASAQIESTGYHPWFSSIWKPPSGELESFLFALQAAIGAIIIGYVLGYYTGQSKERRRQEKELMDIQEPIKKNNNQLK